MLLLLLLGASGALSTAAAAPSRAVYYDGSAPNVRASVSGGADWALADDGFCARELARYVYLTTGAYPDLVDAAAQPGALAANAAHAEHEAIVIASPSSSLLAAAAALSDGGGDRMLAAAELMPTSAEAGAHAIHRLAARGGNDAAVTVIVGAGEFGRLYVSSQAISSVLLVIESFFSDRLHVISGRLQRR